MQLHAIPAPARQDAIRHADQALHEAQDWIAYARKELASENVPVTVYATHTTGRFVGEALEWLTDLLAWTEDDDEQEGDQRSE